MLPSSAPYFWLFTIIGLLFCFAGWHVFHVSTLMLGFLIGSCIGYFSASLTLYTFPSPRIVGWEIVIIIISMCIFGFLGMLLVRTLIKVLLFVAGFSFGMAIFSIHVAQFSGEINPYRLNLLLSHISTLSLISGLICGIIFVLFEKSLIILYTSAFGAYILVSLWRPHAPVFFILLVSGAVFQFWKCRALKIHNLQIESAPPTAPPS